MEGDRPLECGVTIRSSSVSSDPGVSHRDLGHGGGSGSGRGGNATWNRVVIVGGGIAGSLLAKSIQFHADVVLIDQYNSPPPPSSIFHLPSFSFLSLPPPPLLHLRKEYFEIPWATLRSTVEQPVAEKAIFSHTDYLVNGTVITSSAVDVTETDVITADGRHVTYDYLVIATGHTTSSPRCKRDMIEKFKEGMSPIPPMHSA